MSRYSDRCDKSHEVNASDEEKSERLTAFFSGAPMPVEDEGFSLGPSAEQRAAREAEILDQIDGLTDDTESVAARFIASPVWSMAELEADDEEVEIIWDEPRATPYDKALAEVRRLEAQRDGTEEGSDEYHQVMTDLSKARKWLKTEIERDKDDAWRERRATDQWRTGEGREEYNASRRKNRSIPNARRQDMTPEEWAQHEKDRNALKQWKFAKRKAGWNDEKIDAEIPNWWSRRLAKRSGSSS